MSNVVFILGAGASKQAGAPLMANFLDVATDLLLSGGADAYREQFERVFAAIGGLQAVHSKAQLDLNNIESVFTALELGRIIQSVPGTDPAAIPVLIASLKEVIVKTLQQTILFPARKNSIEAPKPYGAFAELVDYLSRDAFPTKSASILTFNYDIAIDVALHLQGLEPNYIIEPTPNRRRSVDLLKLHGSLNWATEVESRRIRPIHLANYLEIYNGYAFDDVGKLTIPIGSQLKEFFSKYSNPATNVEDEPVIVPPSWNKADYHQALSNVWAAAARHLSEAECIFVIGYSLPETDSFFKHLFALGSVGKSALRRLIVFNPDASVDARFRAVLGPGALARYEFKPIPFADAIGTIKQLFPKRN